MDARLVICRGPANLGSNIQHTGPLPHPDGDPHPVSHVYIAAIPPQKQWSYFTLLILRGLVKNEFKNFYSYMQYLGSWYEACMKVISRGPFPGNLSASEIKDKITW
jgi:hypothetical protein